jgi:DNA recombination protein RmuC
MPIDIATIAALTGGGLSVGLFLGWVFMVRGKEEQVQNLQQRERELAQTIEDTKSELSGALANQKALEESRSELRTERDDLRQKLETLQSELSNRRVEIENLQTTLSSEKKAHSEKLEELSNVRGQIEKDLQVLMNGLLDTSSSKFLERANEVLKAQQEKGETGMKSMVGPMKEALDKFQQQVNDMETKRKQDEGALNQQIQDIAKSHTKLNDTTVSLVNALRSAPKTRGRWGEQQLRTLLEMAGMAEYVDFETEKHFNTEEGAQRPDVILTMPGGRTLVIDAKTSLSAYLEAMEADTEEAREAKLIEHARQIRTHMEQLGRKDYWKNLPSDTVDFVVMFVPGEPMYSAAMARDPGLFDAAWEKKVIICSPTTLLGLAKAIAYGWRQEKASKDAQKVHEAGIELYKRLVKLGNDVAGMTKSLNAHVGKHNSFVASLEGRVLPQARKMTELSIGDSYGEVVELEPVEHEVREPLRDRDLLIDGPKGAD